MPSKNKAHQKYDVHAAYIELEKSIESLHAYDTPRIKVASKYLMSKYLIVNLDKL